MIPVLLLLAACRPVPERLVDCRDAECRAEWALRGFEQDPEGTARALRGLTPLDRVLVVGRLVEAFPGRTGRLCDLLPPGPGQGRCRRLNHRPHLWAPPRPTEPGSGPGRPGGGPASTLLDPPAELLSPYAGVPATTACAESADRHACLSARTESAARALDPREVAASCHAVEEGRWRWECIFDGAEATIESRGPSGYRTATELCLEAGSFRANCTAHVVAILAAENAGRSWEEAVRIAGVVRAAWADLAPDFGALVLDRYWSERTRVGIEEAGRRADQPLAGDGLPPEALPHLRAAAVKAMGVAPSVSLAEQVASACRALSECGEAGPVEAHAAPAEGASSPETHAGAAGGSPPRMGRAFSEVIDLWPRDLPGEEQRPAVFYLGTSRRTVAADPRDDLAICVLEAAAREPGAERLLQEGLEWPDDAVRWTAARLAEHRVPDGALAPSVMRPGRRRPGPDPKGGAGRPGPDPKGGAGRPGPAGPPEPFRARSAGRPPAPR